MSQLVLPVGVTGLTVNGKTPPPVPADASSVGVRFNNCQENTHTRRRLVYNTRGISHQHTPEERTTAGSACASPFAPCRAHPRPPAASHALIGSSPECSRCTTQVKGHGLSGVKRTRLLSPQTERVSPFPVMQLEVGCTRRKSILLQRAGRTAANT